MPVNAGNDGVAPWPIRFVGWGLLAIAWGSCSGVSVVSPPSGQDQALVLRGAFGIVVHRGRPVEASEAAKNEKVAMVLRQRAAYVGIRATVEAKDGRLIVEAEHMSDLERVRDLSRDRSLQIMCLAAPPVVPDRVVEVDAQRLRSWLTESGGMQLVRQDPTNIDMYNRLRDRQALGEVTWMPHVIRPQLHQGVYVWSYRYGRHTSVPHVVAAYDEYEWNEGVVRGDESLPAAAFLLEFMPVATRAEAIGHQDVHPTATELLNDVESQRLMRLHVHVIEGRRAWLRELTGRAIDGWICIVLDGHAVGVVRVFGVLDDVVPCAVSVPATEVVNLMACLRSGSLGARLEWLGVQ